jgi:hypothetical protein
MTFLDKINRRYIVRASAADDLGKKIEEAFKKHFPHSLINAKFKAAIYPSVTVYFSLVQELSQLPNGIRNNDPAYTIWQVSGFDKDGNGDNLSVTLTMGGSFNIKPEAGSHNAMSSVKLGWRNKANLTAEKLVQYFDQYAAKSKQVMKANVKNAYGDEKQVAIYEKHLA